MNEKLLKAFELRDGYSRANLANTSFIDEFS
jgi:hypothetical protein